VHSGEASLEALKILSDASPGVVAQNAARWALDPPPVLCKRSKRGLSTENCAIQVAKEEDGTQTSRLAAQAASVGVRGEGGCSRGEGQRSAEPTEHQEWFFFGTCIC
jgi:hypothetical protein